MATRHRNTRRTGPAAAMALFGILVIRSEPSFAHQEGAPYSGAIIEPLRVHHAHIEDEQRLNIAMLREFHREEGLEKRGGISNSLELAGSWGNTFRWGSEILIPYSNLGGEKGRYGVGDVELWPLKYAFINRTEQIWTGVLAFTLPTGNKSKGLGEGRAVVGPNFFIDHTFRNWFFGYNMEYAAAVSGDPGAAFESAAVVSYSLIRDTADGTAATKPNQLLVPAFSVELLSESALSGAERGENEVSVLPGIHLWSPPSGWGLRVGVDVPVSKDKRNDFTVLFQFGNHFSWGKTFGRGT